MFGNANQPVKVWEDTSTRLGCPETAYRIGNVSFYRVGRKVLSLAVEHVPGAQEQPLATVTALPTASPYSA
ncbi:hypothetical protein ACIRF8_31450 [Streptomyces sp. NPDC102406]|uniref:hypothetical protein n=1 Tax=Streptomyces sp. NPDC102406 TaxID=3366171 RepID=UPI0037FAE58F